MYEYMEYEYMDCVYEWARVHRSLQKVQGHRTAQGRSQRGRDSTHRRPCGTSPQSGDRQVYTICTARKIYESKL